MLQWMGGSRRKVTSSRKSTHNRQKQYFEQKKRQQQVPGLEGYYGVKNKRAHIEEPQSLDILSFTNLATVARQGYSSDVNGTELGSNNPHRPSSSTGPQNVPTSCGSSHRLDSCQMPASPCGYALNTIDNKLSEPKEEAYNDVSVLDLLGDDGSKRSSEGRSVPEPHVAFSVEGLGNVGVGTPAHSPRLHDRCPPSPPKASRWMRSRENLKHSPYDIRLNLNDMMCDITVAPDGSPVEPMCGRRGITNNEYSSTKSGLFKFTCMSPDVYENQKGKINDVEGNFFRKEQKWNSASGILDDDFLDSKRYDVAWKNDTVHTEGYPSCTSKVKEYDTYDYDFGNAFSQRSRRMFTDDERSDISAPSSPYFQHLILDEHDLISANQERHQARNGRSNFDSMFSPPVWSFLATGDSQESLSLPSEESCSSAAVREERSYDLGSDPVQLKQRKNMLKNQYQKISRNENDLGKFCAGDTIYAGFDEAFQDKNLLESRNRTSLLNQWSSKAGHCSKSSSTVRDIFSPECISLSEEVFNSDRMASAPSSCHKISMETDTLSFRHNLMSEDELFDLFPVHKLHPTTKSTNRKTKLKTPDNGETSNNVINESKISGQHSGPNVQLQKPVTHQLETGDHFPYLSSAGDFQIYAWLPGLPKQQNVDDVSKEGCRKIVEKPQKVVCVDKGSSSSLSCRAAAVANFKNICSETVDTKDETQKLSDGPQCRDSSGKGEVVPRAMEEGSSQLNHCIDDKLDHSGTCSPDPSQTNNKEATQEGSTPELENAGRKGGSDGNQSYQVMLESYVLQLLSVQKVLLDASEKGMKKKAG